MKALIALDGSPESSVALDAAAGLTWPAGSTIELVTVLPTDLELYGGPWSEFAASLRTEDIRERLERESRRDLDGAATRLRGRSLDVSTSHPVGRAASVIVERADRQSADLIIVGARGHGALERVVLGSVSSEVVDLAHRSVLVARRPTTRRILVGTDGSDQAMSAVSFVAESGLFAGAETRVLHAIDMQPAWWTGFSPEDAATASGLYEAALGEGRRRAIQVTAQASSILEAAGMATSVCIVAGAATAAISGEADSWGADLVVVGTRGHGLIKRLLLGSTARTVLHACSASVLITRRTRASELSATPAQISTAIDPADG